MGANNLINSYADRLLSLMAEQILYSTNSVTSIRSAVILSTNSDGTVNIFIPPDEGLIFSNISNQTPFELKAGDSVELMLKNNNYNNCWVVAKHGTNFTGRSGGSGQLSDEDVQKFTLMLEDIKNLKYQTIPINRPAIYNIDVLYDAGMYFVEEGSVGCPREEISGVLLVLPTVNAFYNTSVNFAALIFFPKGNSTENPDAMYFRTGNTASWRGWSIMPNTTTATFG